MVRLDTTRAYRNAIANVVTAVPDAREAMERSVGGGFEVIGILERELLIDCGLTSSDYLIDVGCGSGRLASALAPYLQGRYLGIDVIPELLEHARSLVDRPGWRFQIADGFSIPERDGQADMVCFFSVFTHLLPEQSYVYLGEAKRVTRPGGKIVVSFLDFSQPAHWEFFQAVIDQIGLDLPLNTFLCRDAFTVWAEHLELEVEAFVDGNAPLPPRDPPLVTSSGNPVPPHFGQSVCVFRR